MRQVREGGQEGTSVGWLNGVRVYAVSDKTRCTIRSEAWVNKRKGYSGDSPNFDVDHVISHSAPIGESCGISRNESKTIRVVRVGWYCHVDAQIIRLGGSCEVLEAGDYS